MSARICGLETEYGLLVSDPSRLHQEDAALALLARCPLEPRVPWDSSQESPGQDARAFAPISPTGIGPREPATAPDLLSDPAGNHPGYMLGNGARLYSDHGHPEYSTPECSDGLDLVACDRAGERLLERCRRHLNRFLPLDQSVRLFKTNSDHQGHSFGCHENYLLDASTYRALFQEGSGPLRAHLVPFLVSRIVICGAGKAGSENGRPAAAYQISQRADFFETELGLQTMSHRPIVNTRDEPHADARRFRRLHVISGDANMAQVSTWLKVGTMQLLLTLLESGAALPDLTLADPLAAIVAISHDPSCRRRVALADGRSWTAVEIQLAFAEAADRHLAASPEARIRYGAVHARWTAALHDLAADPLRLATSLDWVIKWKLLQDWRERKGLDWSSPQLAEIDIRYHDIDPEQGIFHRLEASNGIERVIDEATIRRAEEEPLSPTRARRRAALIREQAATIRAASWSTVVTEKASEHLPDPASAADARSSAKVG